MTHAPDIDSPISVSQSVIDEIVQIGMERAPFEACGILLLGSWKTPWRTGVRRIDNRATNPVGNSVMSSDDILDAVIGLSGAHLDNSLLHEHLVFWHTHPHGQVGPSRIDSENRNQVNVGRCLVVTIPSGEAVEY